MPSRLAAFVLTLACTTVWLASVALVGTAPVLPRSRRWLQRVLMEPVQAPHVVLVTTATFDHLTTSTLALNRPPPSTAPAPTPVPAPTADVVTAAAGSLGRAVIGMTETDGTVSELLNWMVFAAHALPLGSGLTVGTPQAAFAARLSARGIESHFSQPVAPKLTKHQFWAWIRRRSCTTAADGAHRLGLLAELSQTLNTTMLHSDSDAILFGDVWAFVDEHANGSDVLGSRGLVHKHTFRVGNGPDVSSRALVTTSDALTAAVCMGLVAFQPTEPARRLLAEAASIAAADPHADDQAIMNTILRDTLDPEFGPDATYESTQFAYASTRAEPPLQCAQAARLPSDIEQSRLDTDEGRPAMGHVRGKGGGAR